MIISYYYDSYGRVGGKILEQPGMSMRTIFEYNDENKLIAEHNQVANIESSEGAVETHVNYEYISFDEKGNWTKRIIHNVDVEKAPDMDEQTGEIVEGKPVTTKYDRIEVRKIKYYE